MTAVAYFLLTILTADTSGAVVSAQTIQLIHYANEASCLAAVKNLSKALPNNESATCDPGGDGFPLREDIVRAEQPDHEPD